MGILDERKVKRIEVGIPSDISARDEETLYIGATEDSGIALGSTTVVPSNSNNDQRTISIDAFAKQLSSIEGKYDNVSGQLSSIETDYNNISGRLSSTENKYSEIASYIGSTGADMFKVKEIDFTNTVNTSVLSAGAGLNKSMSVYTTSDEKASWIALGVIGWYIYPSNTIVLSRCYLENGNLYIYLSNRTNSSYTFDKTKHDPLVYFKVLFVKRRIIPNKSSAEF